MEERIKVKTQLSNIIGLQYWLGNHGLYLPDSGISKLVLYLQFVFHQEHTCIIILFNQFSILWHFLQVLFLLKVINKVLEVI